MKEAKLCITIPTYNRNALLNATLVSLIPQLSDECRILILDNCSGTPVEESIAPVLKAYPGARISVSRNPFNIGCNANIVKCFEMSKSEWMWLLSDDDEIAQNAISVILDAIKSEPNAIYFNFPVQDHHRPITKVTSGRTNFIDAIDYYADLSLISTNVFRCGVFQEQLQHGYRFMYCCSPHLVMLLCVLSEDKVACLCETPILVGNADNPDNVGWSWLPFAVSRMIILDLPLTQKERKTLARKILESKRILFHITSILVSQAYYANRRSESIYLYDQISFRYFYFSDWLTRLFLVPLCRMLIYFPSFGFRLIRLRKDLEAMKAMGDIDLLLRI